MNSRKELFEVMARAANPDTWHWQPRFDAPGRLEYEAAYILRCKDIDIQRRALEAIEAKGARVAPIEETVEMLNVGGNGVEYTLGDVLAASPFAPEQKR